MNHVSITLMGGSSVTPAPFSKTPIKLTANLIERHHSPELNSSTSTTRTQLVSQAMSHPFFTQDGWKHGVFDGAHYHYLTVKPTGNKPYFLLLHGFPNGESVRS